MRSRLLPLFAATAALALMGAGCAPSTPAVQEPNVQVKADGNVAVQPEAQAPAATPGQSALVPKDFPKNIPIYPNGTVQNASADSKYRQISIQTTDSCQVAKEWFRNASEKLGWKVFSEQAGAEITTLGLRNGIDGGNISLITQDGNCLTTFSSFSLAGLPPEMQNLIQ